jgi:hypothetical protein
VRITIRQICNGGWKFEAWIEPELFQEPIAARGRGRNLKEAVGDLLFQAQRELDAVIAIQGKRDRAMRLRRAEHLPSPAPELVMMD